MDAMELLRTHGAKEDPKVAARLEDRFFSKVNKATAHGCWIWTAAVDRKGYGRFNVNRIPELAHRIAFELVKGAIRPGAVIDHICFRPACVNPDHLRELTPKQNNEHRSGPQYNSTSKVRGVTYDKRRNRWYAQCNSGGKHRWGGSFSTVAEAAQAAVALRKQYMTHSDEEIAA